VKPVTLFVLISSAILFGACASKPAITETPKPAPALVPAAAFEKFSFRISASGIPSKAIPYDSWVMDTNQMMGVHTSNRDAKGQFQTVNAIAQLDPPDYDTLRMFIMSGHLYEIDSSDVTSVCPESELFQIDIVPLAAIKPVRLAFSECAKDYNLLLQPQRRYFSMLLEWFGRMRTKYRPVQP
jgi:hypothetical protein